MSTMTLKEAQSNLSDLVHQMGPGEELVITEDGRPIARLVVGGGTTGRKERKLGTMRGSVLDIAPVFDAPLDDFKEYM